MKATVTFTALVSLLTLAGSAMAQSSYATPAVGLAGYGGYGGYGGYSYHASTWEEGLLRGQAALAEGYGAANYYNSLAAINGQEAYSRYIQNREKATDTYFRMRQINAAAREAARSQPLTHEQYVALARKSAPEGLTNRDYNRGVGRLNWPAVLANDEFAAEREALDAAFRNRSPGDFGPNASFTANVRMITSNLEAKLKNHVRDLDAGEYIAAKRFVQGLARETTQPVAAGLAMSR